MKQVSRYHPLLVTLFFGLAPTPNSDPQKIAFCGCTWRAEC
jgi:hypothetical protein